MNKFWDGTSNWSIFRRKIGYFWLAYCELDTPTGGVHERIDQLVKGLKRGPLHTSQIDTPDWMVTRDECIAFEMGVRFAEKMHGITGEIK
jgi:hypothetical protein